jgi:hypothetical protein
MIVVECKVSQLKWTGSGAEAGWCCKLKLRKKRKRKEKALLFMYVVASRRPSRKAFVVEEDCERQMTQGGYK